MRLVTYVCVDDFLRFHQRWLQRREVINSQLLGGALRARQSPPAGKSYYAAVLDATGPLLAATLTQPFRLALAARQDQIGEEALELLARDLLASGWHPSGCNAPEDLSAACAATWTRVTGQPHRLGLRTRAFEIRQVRHPRYSPGHLRPATLADAALIAGWMDDFEVEALGQSDIPDALAVARHRIVAGDFCLWVDQRPVCMAAQSRPTAHGITINWVYTPPTLRGRGYATSCVAAFSQQLLDAGRQFCTLFTDLANPTSNHIYQQVGYVAVGDFREFIFGA